MEPFHLQFTPHIVLLQTIYTSPLANALSLCRFPT